MLGLIRSTFRGRPKTLVTAVLVVRADAVRCSRNKQQHVCFQLATARIVTNTALSSISNSAGGFPFPCNAACAL
jgi:hypothetical protein